jgi:Ubiquitin-2 like Rad60 SUMO-like
LIDESLTVNELTEIIAEKMNLPNPEEFSLQLDGAERWLHPTQTLQQNRVGDDDILVMNRKFFFSDANCSSDNPQELHLLYVQVRWEVLLCV